MITLITNSSPLSEIGVKTLSSYLSHKNIECTVIYLNNIMSDFLDIKIKQEILNIAKNSKLVGISLMTTSFYLSKEITCFLKKETEIPIVWGGVHPTVCPDESIEFCDFVCVGEGEEPLYLLYEKINKNINNFEDIPNLVYKKNQNIKKNSVKFIVEKLDSLPFPDYEFKRSYIYYQNRILKIPNELASKKHILGSTFLFYSQRGCPQACTYCSNYYFRNLYKGSGKSFYRFSSVGRIIKELEVYKKLMPFIKLIIINDDDFLAREKNEIEEFSCLYKKNIDIPFFVNVIGRYVTDEKIKLLVTASLTQVSMGIQTGSDRVLRDVYRRPMLQEATLKAAHILNKYKNVLRIKYDLIVDNPYETESDKVETVKLLNRLPRPFDLQLHSLVFFPGTLMYTQAKEDGFLVNDEIQTYRKRYQIDIGNDYFNAIFLLNAIFVLPAWINSFLIGRIALGNILFAPFRLIMKRSIKLFLILKGLKVLMYHPALISHYLKYLTLKRRNT